MSLKALSLLALLSPAPAFAATGYLETVRHHITLGSTVPANGDQNPYAIVVAPASAGKIHKDDVLVDNFNDKNNLQGLGTTIVTYTPSTKTWSQFAAIPRHLPSCPGGIGLTTAMTMLKSGWVIVGSLPSTDGTTATKGTGCLVVLDSNGNIASTITDPKINGPWGNMAVIDNGDRATLFLSNTGFGVGAATDNSPVVTRANVLRIELDIPNRKAPTVASTTVIADGFGEQADRGVFIIGPTGLALGPNGSLYVASSVDNSINRIDAATTRTTSAGTGTVVTRDALFKRPLALAVAPNSHLLTTNGLNGQVVEVDPATGKQVYAQWIDTDKAQTPPGSGDLFGIAMRPAGDGFYYVEDDMNTLVSAQ